ncbi:hypothetical protein AB0K48_34400, partial [Nonomuraea sp. NPDC055795]
MGATNHDQALALLGRIDNTADGNARERRNKVHEWLAAIYPAADAQQPWGVLQPDRLAERFVGRHLSSRSDLADRMITGASASQVATLLTVYARAAGHRVFQGGLDAGLTELCLRHASALVSAVIDVVPQLERPAPLLAALEPALDDSAISPDDLLNWEARLPQTSQVLSEWAVRVTERLVAYYRNGGDRSHLARSLDKLSIRLGAAGRWKEALRY